MDDQHSGEGGRRKPAAVPAHPSALDSVVVYAEGAVCRRRATVPVPAGGRLRLTGLPRTLDGRSLRARVLAGPAGTAVTEARVEQLAEIRDESELPALRREVDEARERLSALVERHRLVLASIAETSALRAVPPQRRRPDEALRRTPADAWLELAEFVDERLAGLQARAEQLTREIELADHACESINDRLERASTAGPSRPVETATTVLLTLTSAPAPAGEPDTASTPTTPTSTDDLNTDALDTTPAHLEIELEYGVAAARWIPAYRLSYRHGSDSGRLVLRASVAQQTGEDWTGVRLALSTADLDRRTDLPKLRSLRIGRSQPAPPPSGWREPPSGLSDLFTGYDAADELPGKPRPRSGPIAVSAPTPNPPAWPHQPLAAGPHPAAPGRPGRAGRPGGRPYGVSGRGGGTLDSADDEYPLPSPPPPGPGFAGYGGAPGPQAMPPAPGAPAAPGGPTPAAYGAAPAPAPSAAPIAQSGPPEAMKRMAHRKRAGAVESADLWSDGPPGTPGTLTPAAALLDYPELVLAGPDEPANRRGTLHPPTATPDTGPGSPGALGGLGRVRGLRLPRHAVAPRVSAGSFDHRFDAAAPADIPSDGTWHTVTVDEIPLSVRPEYVTVPAVEEKVYATLVLANRTDRAVLAGPVEVTVDDEFLLTAALPTLAPGGARRVGIGVTESIEVARRTELHEAAAGKLNVLNNSTVLDHRVHVELANRLGRAVTVEVRERVPVSSDAEIRIEERADWHAPTVPTPQCPPSTRLWRVELPPGGRAELDGGYQIKIPAGKAIVGGNRRN
ncbi:DUF4139 domain-containing protein [Streptomyces sp. SP17BM10]|uniref:DUF4139 domain-containing protein n=1 Tax=Streptomyces sp. SP17BM10 TaxID=3002530 RepID=UPI002E785ED8|nr:DUF4139 domain-containing protein [Streptomyces sp. SP17BM10]MEE1781671.1 DUF4139 domain-containing protein [Streptomyces sp. SP17BM10]